MLQDNVVLKDMVSVLCYSIFVLSVIFDHKLIIKETKNFYDGICLFSASVETPSYNNIKRHRLNVKASEIKIDI